jgi:REP element-mobilizing transposase RayT
MTRSHTEFNDNHTPIAYLITFRAYGTWLHGDGRGSVDRFHRVYGAPMLPPNAKRRKYERGLLTQPPVKLDADRRAAVEKGVRETCTKRTWLLWAFNIRTNHVHSVVSSEAKPETILSSLKANATRSMREAGCWQSERTPWVYRGSKRYLWNEKQLNGAIAYVLYDQETSTRSRLVTEPRSGSDRMPVSTSASPCSARFPPS